MERIPPDLRPVESHGAGDGGSESGTRVRLGAGVPHDDPAVLQAYAERLQADPAIWSWVRVPDPVQTQQLLRRFEVVVVPDGRGDYEHNAALLVVDERGRLVRVFDYAEQQLALDYARHLARTGRS